MKDDKNKKNKLNPKITYIFDDFTEEDIEGISFELTEHKKKTKEVKVLKKKKNDGNTQLF